MLHFGKPITLESANRQIKEFLNVKSQYTVNSGFAETAPENARRYFETTGLSFVFEKEILQHILDTPWCNGLRVYYACMDQQQTGFWGSAQEQTTLPAGTPTIILVPATIHADGTIINLVPHNEQMIAGGEHPGLKQYEGSPQSFDLRNDR